MKRLIRWIPALLVFGFLDASATRAQMSKQEMKPPTAVVALYRVVPGKHLEFLKWAAENEAIAKEAGVPASQVYAHTNGDNWDYLQIAPDLNDAQQAKLDEITKKHGHKTGFCRGSGVSHDDRLAPDTMVIGPVTAADLVGGEQVEGPRGRTPSPSCAPLPARGWDARGLASLQRRPSAKAAPLASERPAACRNDARAPGVARENRRRGTSMRQADNPSRRTFLTSLAAAGAAAVLRPAGVLAYPEPAAARPGPILTRPIPSTGRGCRSSGSGAGSRSMWATTWQPGIPAQRSCAFFQEGEGA
jgi:hypothetical protein